MSAFGPFWSCDVGMPVPSLLPHILPLLMGLPSFTSDWPHGHRPVCMDMEGPWCLAHCLASLPPALLMMLSATSLKGRRYFSLHGLNPCLTGHFSGSDGQITKLFYLKNICDFWGTWTQILRDMQKLKSQCGDFGWVMPLEKPELCELPKLTCSVYFRVRTWNWISQVLTHWCSHQTSLPLKWKIILMWVSKCSV